MFGTFLSPAGIIMLPLAVGLDAIGLVLLILSFLGVGIPFSWILDLMGLFTIGLWTYFYSGTMRGTKAGAEIAEKAKEKVKEKTEKAIEKKIKSKFAQKALKRMALMLVGELIPFVGDAGPFWTIHVYKTLKEREKEQ